MRKGLGVVPSFLSKSLPVNAIHCHRIEREEKDGVQEETEIKVICIRKSDV